MFRKNCPHCGNKIKKDFKFCPSCSKNLNSKHDQEDYGFLGRDDFIEENMSMSGFSDGFIDKMFNSAVKMLEKQMRNMQNDVSSKNTCPNRMPPKDLGLPGLNVQFFVNGKKVFPENNRRQIKHNHQPEKIKNSISDEKLKRFADLPRSEPKTMMKRLSGKLIYDLSVPGVKDISDILINQLESSIEIKALSDKKVYSKNINVKLPILRYGLEKDHLIIELQVSN
ncbi:MAG: zinc ribbon domain-containing protein [archaeon]